MKEKNKFYTYILECADKTLYTGYTTNLDKRIKVHNDKKGSKYTRNRTPVKYVYYKEFDTKSEAMSFEYFIKQLSRKDKIRLINNEIEYEELINN